MICPKCGMMMKEGRDTCLSCDYTVPAQAEPQYAPSATYPPGQQPGGYPPYQPQPGYQQPAAYPTVPQPNTAGQPKKWSTTKKVVAIVVVIVIILVATRAIAYFMFLSMKSDTSGPGSNLTLVAFKHESWTMSLANAPTTNGGVWSAQIGPITGKVPKLSAISTVISRSDIDQFTMTAVTPASSDLSYTAGPVKWYLQKGTTSTMRFVDGSTVKDLDATTAKDVNGDEFSTIEGARLVYIDNNGDGKMSTNDTLYVYQDTNADGNPEVLSGDLLELRMGDTMIGKFVLY